MSTIPGPLIRFVIDQPGLSAAVTPAMQQLRQQAQATSAAIADDWKRMAAQLRASIASGVTTSKEMTQEQSKLVSVLDRQITVLRERDTLTNKELAALKAMTLERERQADAIKRGVSVGVTTGTTSALGQASTQTMLGLERILDSLVNRYFGGAAGSALRTVRDVSYYSNQASGGATSGLFGLSGTTLGILGGGAAAAAIVAGLTAASVKGGELAVELTKLSEKTGLTVEETIKLRAASEVLDADFDRVTVGFRSLSKELVLASTADLPGASKSAKEAAALFKALGVDVKLAAQDPFQAIQQLAKSFAALPDGIVKTTAATTLFGRGGMEWIPILEKLSPAISATAKSSEALSNTLTDGKSAKSMDDLRAQTVNFRQETDALEVALSKKLLPTLVSLTTWINDHWGGISKFSTAFFSGPLGAHIALTGDGSSSSSSSTIDWNGINSFLKSDTPKIVSDTAAAEAKLGDASKEAAEAQRKLTEEYKKFAETAGHVHPGLTEQQKADQETLKVLGPSLGIGTSGLNRIWVPPLSESQLQGLGPQPPNLAGTNLGVPQSIVDAYNSVVYDYVQETQSETEKIKAEYDKQFDYWRDVQDKYPQYAKNVSDAIYKLKEEETTKLNDLQKKQLEKYKQEADKLFDDLLEGKTKSFTKSLEKDLMNIVTEPVRKVFESLIGGIFSNLNTAINGGSSSSGSSSSSLAGWLGKVFSPASPGGTPGIFSGSLGLGSSSGRAGVAIQTGQTGVQTSTMYVSANVVNVGGSSSSGAPGSTGSNLLGLGGGFGTFFGNLNPFANAGFGGNLGLGFPSSGGTGGGGLFGGQLGTLIGGLLIGGLGAASGSIPSEAMGAATVAGALANVFGAQNASPLGNPGPNGPQNLGQQLGGIFGGLGMMASGISQGGVGGTLSSTAGGAEIGTMIAPGIGTAIGAAAGAIAGIISSIIGGPSWPQRVARAMKNQQYNLPPSETFNFAMGNSMSQTMSTGFSQTNDTFSSFNLPANTPFWANPIVGPLSKQQMELLQQEEAGLNPSSPFYGLNPSPFSGQGPLGFKAGPSPSVSVNFSLPGFVDAQSATAVFARYGQSLAQIVGSQLNQSSSGFGRSVRSAVALP